MSHFSEFSLGEMKDEEALLKALKEMGFAHIEVHATPQPLYGYQGDKRAQQAHIIIRRQYVGGSSNDIGFERMPDGTYRAWISDYDKTRYNDKWLKKLKSAYSIERITKMAKFKGWHIKETVEKSKVRIELSRW